jgi:hypothetical protein
MPKRIDLAGRKYGKLTVIEYSHTKYGKCFWKCRCDCGKLSVVLGRYLKTGHTTSCGCQRGNRTTIHGMSKARIYRIWRSMKTRTNPNNREKYPYYSGRGITRCKEWDQFEPFYDWAMENGYSDNLSIDRIDVNGNYEPSNCRWATLKEQGRNKRNNHLIEIDNIKITASELTDITKIGKSCMAARVRRGYSGEKLLKEKRKYVKKTQRQSL